MPRKKPDSQPKNVGEGVRRVKIDYLKSSLFRVVYVDGAWGGLRGDLMFQLALYNERSAIPKSLTVELDPQNLNVEETPVEVESRHSVVREVEMCALFDLATAKSIRNWLDEHIRAADARLEKVSETDESS